MCMQTHIFKYNLYTIYKIHEKLQHYVLKMFISLFQTIDLAGSSIIKKILLFGSLVEMF